MSKVKYVLYLEVEGESLEDIDNGLVQAAGARLMARMENPPTLNGDTLIRGPAIREIDLDRTVLQKEMDLKLMRKHQEKLATLKAEKKRKEEEEEKLELEKIALHMDPAVKALTAIHNKFGAHAVKELLEKFGATKVRELKADQKESFIQECNIRLEVQYGN